MEELQRRGKHLLIHASRSFLYSYVRLRSLIVLNGSVPELILQGSLA